MPDSATLKPPCNFYELFRDISYPGFSCQFHYHDTYNERFCWKAIEQS